MKIAFVILLVAVGAGGYWFVAQNSDRESANVEIHESQTSEQHLVTGLMFEDDVFTVTFPGGATKDYEVKIPYVMVGGEKVYPFGTEKGVWIRGYAVSPSGQYVYLGKGAGPGDAGVQANIYDVSSRSLEAVIKEDGSMIGFGSEEEVAVSWKDNDILHIEYNNNGLAPGAPESGPAIGLQIFESMSADQPWIVQEK